MVQFHFQTIESCALHQLPVPADQVPDLFADILSGPTLTSIRRNEITERTTDANGHGDDASFVMRGIQFINLNTGQAATPGVPHRKHRVAGGHGEIMPEHRPLRRASPYLSREYSASAS